MKEIDVCIWSYIGISIYSWLEVIFDFFFKFLYIIEWFFFWFYFLLVWGELFKKEGILGGLVLGKGYCREMRNLKVYCLIR